MNAAQTEPKPEPKRLTVAEAAAVLDVAPRVIEDAMALYRLTEGQYGLAHSQPVAGKYRIHPQSLEDWEKRTRFRAEPHRSPQSAIVNLQSR